jgi:hypothetical protein
MSVCISVTVSIGLNTTSRHAPLPAIAQSPKAHVSSAEGLTRRVPDGFAVRMQWLSLITEPAGIAAMRRARWQGTSWSLELHSPPCPFAHVRDLLHLLEFKPTSSSWPTRSREPIATRVERFFLFVSHHHYLLSEKLDPGRLRQAKIRGICITSGHA